MFYSYDVQGKEDQQRYGTKFSNSKIVSYRKFLLWWIKK